MEIKTFDELTMPDERTLLFNIMKTPEDIARYQQQAIADCDLVPEVPEETHRVLSGYAQSMPMAFFVMKCSLLPIILLGYC